MGVLDDAIREHLELKRQHGASDDEIARQEAEALGPARRAPLEAEAEAAVEEPPGAEEPVAAEPVAGEPAAPAAEPEDGSLPASPGEAAQPRPEPESMPEPEPLAVEPEPLTAGDETVARDVEALPPTEAAEPLSGRDAAAAAPTTEPAIESLPPEPEPAPEPPVERPPVEDAPPVAETPVEEAPVEEAPVEEASERGAEDGEDLLEETPDFLQDTPDHDRLWFEQKPPRDFDLD